MQRLLAILLALAVCGCPQIPGPGPLPPPEPTATANACLRDYGDRQAALFDSVAASLDTGDIKDASAANEALATGQQSARQTAFKPLDNRLQSSIGGDKWDAKRAAGEFRAIAKEFRK